MTSSALRQIVAKLWTKQNPNSQVKSMHSINYASMPITPVKLHFKKSVENITCFTNLQRPRLNTGFFKEYLTTYTHKLILFNLIMNIQKFYMPIIICGK